MVTCPSCAAAQSPRLLCDKCGAPLAAAMDCFAALGLPKKLVIDRASLERTYHALGRRIHPDRFAASPMAVREASLKATALLTRSYRILRDPVSRALYWLELGGEKLADGGKQVPAELAAMVFEVQEQLAELRSARATADCDSGEIEADLARRRASLRAMMEDLQEQLQRNFARWDADAGSSREHLAAELKSVLSRIAYLRTLLRDVERELEPARAA